MTSDLFNSAASSLEEALLNGNPTYYGKPCPKDHRVRFVKGKHRCVVCARASNRAFVFRKTGVLASTKGKVAAEDLAEALRLKRETGTGLEDLL